MEKKRRSPRLKEKTEAPMHASTTKSYLFKRIPSKVDIKRYLKERDHMAGTS